MVSKPIISYRGFRYAMPAQAILYANETLPVGWRRSLQLGAWLMPVIECFSRL
jgi:hypothetical protein